MGCQAGARFICSAALLLWAGVATAGPKMQWVNADSLSRSDRNEIVALLRRAGLGAPETVTFIEGWTETYVRASSPVSVRGARRRWNWVNVNRRSERSPCGQVDALCETRWWVPYPLQRSETWRVTDGEWFRDVALGKGLTLSDVEPLVRAMHRREVVDARHIAADDPHWPPGMRRVPRQNPDEVTDIAREDGEFHVYVGLGHGQDHLRIRENAGRFEMVEWSEILY